MQIHRVIAAGTVVRQAHHERDLDDREENPFVLSLSKDSS